MSWSSDITGRAGDIKGLGGRRSGYPEGGGGTGSGWLPGMSVPPSSRAGRSWPLGGDSVCATKWGCFACRVGTIRASVDGEAWAKRAEGKVSVPASEGVGTCSAIVSGDVRPGGRLGRGWRDGFTSEFVRDAQPTMTAHMSPIHIVNTR